MNPHKLLTLLSLGFFLASSAYARTWTQKNGKELEGEFVKYDENGRTVTIKKGAKEHTLTMDALSEGDQKWITEHVSTLKNEKANEAEFKGAADEILLLLNKSPDEVALALKTVKMVEDFKSLTSLERKKPSDGSVGIVHSYDSGKVKFIYYGGTLKTIELFLMDGYKGAMPLGLQKNIHQKDATELLNKQDFKVLDWGTSPPGWGVAHSLNSSPTKVVAVMTMKRDSPELALIRIMQK